MFRRSRLAILAILAGLAAALVAAVAASAGRTTSSVQAATGCQLKSAHSRRLTGLGG
jgi:hypothetical protein